jgi:hypothetical protein
MYFLLPFICVSSSPSHSLAKAQLVSRRWRSRIIELTSWRCYCTAVFRCFPNLEVEVTDHYDNEQPPQQAGESDSTKTITTPTATPECKLSISACRALFPSLSRFYDLLPLLPFTACPSKEQVVAIVTDAFRGVKLGDVRLD